MKITDYLTIFSVTFALTVGDMPIVAKEILMGIIFTVIIERISKIVELEEEINELKKIIKLMEE